MKACSSTAVHKLMKHKAQLRKDMKRLKGLHTRTSVGLKYANQSYPSRTATHLPSPSFPNIGTQLHRLPKKEVLIQIILGGHFHPSFPIITQQRIRRPTECPFFSSPALQQPLQPPKPLKHLPNPKAPKEVPCAAPGVPARIRRAAGTSAESRPPARHGRRYGARHPGRIQRWVGWESEVGGSKQRQDQER